MLIYRVFVSSDNYSASLPSPLLQAYRQSAEGCYTCCGRCKDTIRTLYFYMVQKTVFSCVHILRPIPTIPCNTAVSHTAESVSTQLYCQCQAHFHSKYKSMGHVIPCTACLTDSLSRWTNPFLRSNTSSPSEDTPCTG